MLPKEKAQSYGIQALNTLELLALLLYTGTTHYNVFDLASVVVQAINTLPTNPHKAYHGIKTLAYIPETRKIQMLAILELLRRHSAPTTPYLSSPSEIFKLFAHLQQLKEEHAYILFLGPNNARTYKLIAKGDNASVRISAKKIYNQVRKEATKRLIMVHNHPSGDPSPSEQDVLITLALHKALKREGISLVDHVIIGRGAYFSFRQNGML